MLAATCSALQSANMGNHPKIRIITSPGRLQPAHLHHACCVLCVAGPERQLLEEDQVGKLLGRLIRGTATHAVRGDTLENRRAQKSTLCCDWNSTMDFNSASCSYNIVSVQCRPRRRCLCLTTYYSRCAFTLRLFPCSCLSVSSQKKNQSQHTRCVNY
jgi:hypothetical protein